MPKTLIVEDDEVLSLQLMCQKANADLPTLPGLPAITAKIAALSDPLDPADRASPTPGE